jgi:hypothetical protein
MSWLPTQHNPAKLRRRGGTVLLHRGRGEGSYPARARRCRHVADTRVTANKPLFDSLIGADLPNRGNVRHHDGVDTVRRRGTGT